MNRLLLAPLLLAAATPAAAQQYDGGYAPQQDAVPPASTPYDGGYAAPRDDAPTAGLRIELRAGWERDRVEVLYRDASGVYRDSGGRNGISYGVEAGYDINLQGYGVIGAYVGAEDSTTKDCAEEAGFGRSCVESGRTLTVGIRGGYALGRNALVYVKGGYSNGQFKASYTDFTTPRDNFALSNTLSGFHLGTGVEMGIGRNAYAKVEYLYTDFNGSEERSASSFASVDPSRHQVVGGVGMRF